MEKEKNSDPYAEVKGRFCSVCGRTLNQLEVNDNLVIQKTLGFGSKYDEQEVRIEFCHCCFDGLLDSCKRLTIVKDWGA